MEDDGGGVGRRGHGIEDTERLYIFFSFIMSKMLQVAGRKI